MQWFFLPIADFFDGFSKLGGFLGILAHIFGWPSVYHLVHYYLVKPFSLRLTNGRSKFQSLCALLFYMSAVYSFVSAGRYGLGAWVFILMFLTAGMYFNGNDEVGGNSDGDGERLNSGVPQPIAAKQPKQEPPVSDFISLYNPRKPTVSFSDVHGMLGLKAELLAAIEKIRTAKKNGILLSGDPGNGKTFIAEALAGELKWGFLPITISDIESRWLGQSTEQLKAVFDAARSQGPLILFFDECDSMLRNRASMMGSGGSDESLKKANTFLTSIVDIRRQKNIIVIAATNFPEELDTAAMRDGRFDFKIEVRHPDKDARLGLLTKFSKGVVFEDGVLDRLVKRWEGFSVVRIRSIAEKIADNAKAQGRNLVGVKDAMAALRTIQGSSGAIPSYSRIWCTGSFGMMS